MSSIFAHASDEKIISSMREHEGSRGAQRHVWHVVQGGPRLTAYRRGASAILSAGFVLLQISIGEGCGWRKKGPAEKHRSTNPRGIDARSRSPSRMADENPLAMNRPALCMGMQLSLKNGERRTVSVELHHFTTTAPGRKYHFFFIVAHWIGNGT